MSKVFQITGATRGMGVEFARAALAAGHNVSATGRRREAVQAAVGAHPNLLALQLDVTVRSRGAADGRPAPPEAVGAAPAPSPPARFGSTATQARDDGLRRVARRSLAHARPLTPVRAPRRVAHPGRSTGRPSTAGGGRPLTELDSTADRRHLPAPYARRLR